LEEDIIKYKGADLSVEHEYKEYSKIAFDWLPSEIIQLRDGQGILSRECLNTCFNRDLEE
jgi:hypothetical protein